MCKNSNLLTGLWLEEVEHNVPSGLMTLSRKKCYLSFFPALPGASEFMVQHLTVKTGKLVVVRSVSHHERLDIRVCDTHPSHQKRLSSQFVRSSANSSPIHHLSLSPKSFVGCGSFQRRR